MDLYFLVKVQYYIEPQLDPNMLNSTLFIFKFRDESNLWGVSHSLTSLFTFLWKIQNYRLILIVSLSTALLLMWECLKPQCYNLVTYYMKTCKCCHICIRTEATKCLPSTVFLYSSKLKAAISSVPHCFKTINCINNSLKRETMVLHFDYI